MARARGSRFNGFQGTGRKRVLQRIPGTCRSFPADTAVTESGRGLPHSKFVPRAWLGCFSAARETRQNRLNCLPFIRDNAPTPPDGRFRARDISRPTQIALAAPAEFCFAQAWQCWRGPRLHLASRAMSNEPEKRKSVTFRGLLGATSAAVIIIGATVLGREGGDALYRKVTNYFAGRSLAAATWQRQTAPEVSFESPFALGAGADLSKSLAPEVRKLIASLETFDFGDASKALRVQVTRITYDPASRSTSMAASKARSRPRPKPLATTPPSTRLFPCAFPTWRPGGRLTLTPRTVRNSALNCW